MATVPGAAIPDIKVNWSATGKPGISQPQGSVIMVSCQTFGISLRLRSAQDPRGYGIPSGNGCILAGLVHSYRTDSLPQSQSSCL